MISSENISQEDSLMANVGLKTSTASSQQSEILASTKDTIPQAQEASNPLGVKEKENIKGGLISDGVFNRVQSSKKMCQITILNF